jgi:MoaA/NifB/PqqE/SkfB family radical SAM enzyme
MNNPKPEMNRSPSAWRVLGSLLKRYTPAAVYGGSTGFALLARIRNESAEAKSPETAAAILDRSRSAVYAHLHRRFPALVARSLTVKLLNLMLARYHQEARSSYLLSRPFGLVLDPCNTCQLGCPGCVHSVRNEQLKIFDWPNGTLSEDRMSGFLRSFGPYAMSANFFNYGEPLLNLQTPRYIRVAKSYLLATAISTSLSVRKFDAEAYVESGLDFMMASIDGVTQAVYQKFRRNGDLSLVLENARKLVEAKRRLRRRTPLLCWNFLAFEHNRHERDAARRLAKQMGFDQFCVRKPFEVDWDDPEIKASSTDETSLTSFGTTALWTKCATNVLIEDLDRDGIDQAFEKPFASELRAAPDDAPSPGPTCHWLYKSTVMDAKGRILPCCGAPGPGKDLVFGQFPATSLESDGVFNSEKYRKARRLFTGKTADRESLPYCSQCEWDHGTVSFGRSEIYSYWRAADGAFFDRRTSQLLADW